MAFKVLVVDDSAFYRRRLTKILNDDRQLEVVGEAADGKEAISLIRKLSPDVVTMDVEMPVLDGISAVRRIMDETPVPILMFSSLTHEGATATLDALDAGALDFLPKKFEDISQNNAEALATLRTKVRVVARRRPFMREAKSKQRIERRDTATRQTTPVKSTFMRSSSVLTGQSYTAEQVSVTSIRRSGKRYQCLAIGASTGGPVALQTLLSELPASFSVPILIVQHMPSTFTEAFAQRLNSKCAINVIHAETGMTLQPGHAYIAPGGKQCLLDGRADFAKIIVRDARDSEHVSYKPSVDLSFNSIAEVYGGSVLGVILTGMGADGKLGCAALKQKGATIWAQDQASSVVYGMPQAVAAEGISQKSIGIDHIAGCLVTELDSR